jgi:2-haloacid dehalogenase
VTDLVRTLAIDFFVAKDYRASGVVTGAAVSKQESEEEAMSNDRREFIQIAGAAAALAAAPLAATSAVAQTGATGQFKGIKALAFDAYGTLFDVFSVTALCERLFSGKGNQLAQTWRVKQLQYSLLRTTMGRHRDFWGLTEDGLVWASKNLQLDLTADKKKQLMDAYLNLAAFPDVKPGLEALKKDGLKLAILSNGEPRMLEAAAKSGGIRDLLDDVVSVEEVKVFKASPRVYNLASERLKVTNSELGFVSANNWDAVGAVSAGLRTFWIQRTTADVPEELGFQADTIVKALTELAPLLRG